MTTGFGRRNATGEDPVPDRMRVRRSRHFRAAPIENAIVQTQSDGIATAMVVNFVRRHLNWTEIRKRAAKSPSGPARFEVRGRHEFVREFEAFLEPHQALKVVMDIIACVRSLPEEERARYGIAASSVTDDPGPDV